MRLRVVMLQARPSRRSAVPIVYLPGGPGDPAGLDAAALRHWRAFQQRAGWASDLVLFDPRGTGSSRPRPDCGPNEAVGACVARIGRDRLAALGVDGQLADLSALIVALGVAHIDLWAVSYGTRLALLFGERHPDRVRAMALDSLVPFGPGGEVDLTARIDHAVARLNDWCASHLRCAAGGPPVANTLRRLLGSYGGDPPLIDMAVLPRRARRLRLTPARLLIMLLLADYRPWPADQTIARLRRAARGDDSALAPFARLFGRSLARPGHNRAVFQSTRCALEGHVHVADKASLRYPWLETYISARADRPACRHWPVARIAVPLPIRLPGPTLVIAGREDVSTPLHAARRFVMQHRRASLLGVAGAGHAPSLSAPCAQQFMAAFWRRPYARRAKIEACGRR